MIGLLLKKTPDLDTRANAKSSQALFVPEQLYTGLRFVFLAITHSLTHSLPHPATQKQEFRNAPIYMHDHQLSSVIACPHVKKRSQWAAAGRLLFLKHAYPGNEPDRPGPEQTSYWGGHLLVDLDSRGMTYFSRRSWVGIVGWTRMYVCMCCCIQPAVTLI